ncbi:MAG TPA: ATP-binding protein [Polyangia bacterium]|nr:ATP-binding protein [Polyangia bacterium]
MTTKSIKERLIAQLTGPLAVLLGAASVAAITFVALHLFGRDDIANVAILYLFAIAAVSLRFGYRASIAAAITSAICFDYYFLLPYHSLAITHGRQLVSFGGMFGTAIFISTLNEKLRKQARVARQNERRSEHHYALIKALAEAESTEALCTSAARQIDLASNAFTTVLLRGPERFRCAYRAGGASALGLEDLDAADWAAAHLETAGMGTHNFPEAAAYYLPLIAARGCVGVLALRPHGHPTRASSLAVSMARQLAIALERMLLGDEKRSALLEAETERIRSAVLSSVSHDLRAPLAVIASASSTLVEHGNRLPSGGRDEMARIIHDEARRLNELLKSLLDITRLQSGSLHVSRDWESLEEVVGSMLDRIESCAGGRRLLTTVPSDLPLLHIDAILIEQVLLNLVDNAIKHTAAVDQPIEIEVALRGAEALVSVIDHGTGIDPAEMTRIFDKFYRSESSRGSGLGLGLTIARGIVAAHGGRIWASSTAGGGLSVHFTLPLSVAAPGPVIEPEPTEGLLT